jgi:hypothetical protein
VSLHHPTLSTDPSVRRVRRLLDELVAAHLITETGRTGTASTDVVRRFARQCGADLLDRNAVDEWVRLRCGTVGSDPRPARGGFATDLKRLRSDD